MFFEEWTLKWAKGTISSQGTFSCWSSKGRFSILERLLILRGLRWLGYFSVWSQGDGEDQCHRALSSIPWQFSLFSTESLRGMYDSNLKPDGWPALFLLYWDLPDQLWTCGESAWCWGGGQCKGGVTLLALKTVGKEGVPVDLMYVCF